MDALVGCRSDVVRMPLAVSKLQNSERENRLQFRASRWYQSDWRIRFEISFAFRLTSADLSFELRRIEFCEFTNYE